MCSVKVAFPIPTVSATLSAVRTLFLKTRSRGQTSSWHLHMSIKQALQHSLCLSSLWTPISLSDLLLPLYSLYQLKAPPLTQKFKPEISAPSIPIPTQPAWPVVLSSQCLPGWTTFYLSLSHYLHWAPHHHSSDGSLCIWCSLVTHSPSCGQNVPSKSWLLSFHFPVQTPLVFSIVPWTKY